MQKNYSRALAFHALGYLLLESVVAVFANSLGYDGSPTRISQVLFLLTVAAAGHAAVAWRKWIPMGVLVAFFLADSAVVMVLCRSTGASTSPFLVLFPLVALGSAVTFPTLVSIFLVGFCVLFQVLSVGFGPAVVGNVLATITTSGLGIYLVKALANSGVLLRQSEGARKRLENLQKAILANIPSGLMSIDSQGRIIQVNGVGLKILETSESQILYTPLKALLPQLEEPVYKISTSATQELDYEKAAGDRPTVRYRKASSGEHLELGYSLARLYDPEDRSILGSLLVFQDLTKIMRMEESLRISEKLAAVGKLAAGIAHEIRNPLAGISGSAQLLAGLEHLSAEDRSLLQIIQRESTRLDVLITEFLEYVKPSSAKIEPVDLSLIVDQVVQSMKVNVRWKGLNCDIRVRSTDDTSPMKVLGDPNKITQALINFVLNSGQAGAAQVEIVLEPRNGRVLIVDDGRGISAEHQKRLFEPFFTTKESGTGLGLATSYKALEGMGARVEVVSPIPDFAPRGGGTLFRVEFQR